MEEATKVLSFYGPPGTGKGTIARRCVRELGYKMLSTGDLARKHIQEQSDLGKQLAESAFSIVAVVILALIFWEAVISGVERYLAQTDGQGNVVERSARIRTLTMLHQDQHDQRDRQ